MTDLCEPAVEMQALEMSHSLLLAAPAVTCHGWVLDCEHSPSTLGAIYRPSAALWAVPGKSGGGRQQTVLVRAVVREIWCCALFRVHCSLGQCSRNKGLDSA